MSCKSVHYCYSGEVGHDDDETEVPAGDQGPDVGVLVRLYAIQTKYVTIYDTTIQMYIALKFVFVLLYDTNEKHNYVLYTRLPTNSFCPTS